MLHPAVPIIHPPVSILHLAVLILHPAILSSELNLIKDKIPDLGLDIVMLNEGLVQL